MCALVREKPPSSSPHIIDEIMLAYVQPRLDAAVTRGLNHLLKSPFAVHPGTGRVCVPIDPANAEDFDPFAVPSVFDVVNGEVSLDDHIKLFRRGFD